MTLKSSYKPEKNSILLATVRIFRLITLRSSTLFNRCLQITSEL